LEYVKKELSSGSSGSSSSSGGKNQNVIDVDVIENE
jgi:hypothetical protein